MSKWWSANTCALFKQQTLVDYEYDSDEENEENSGSDRLPAKDEDEENIEPPSAKRLAMSNSPVASAECTDNCLGKNSCPSKLRQKSWRCDSNVAYRVATVTVRYGCGTVRYGCGTIRLQYGTGTVRYGNSTVRNSTVQKQYGAVAVRSGCVRYRSSLVMVLILSRTRSRP